MKPRKLSIARLSFPLASAIAALLAAPLAQAQEVWDGGGVDDNFGTNDNWLDNTAPSVGSGTILHFTGGTRPTPNNNYTTGDNFGEWWLLAGATAPFTVGGSGFGLFNKIENSSSQLFSINTAGIYARDGSMEINPVGGNITIGSSTSIELDGNTTLDVFDGNNNRTLTINGTLSNGNGTGGNGALELNQTATVILTGTNDYGGTVLNNSSTLRVGAAGTTGTLGVGNVTLNNTSSLIFDRSNAITVTNAISGAGSVTKLGADTLTLKGSNNFSGGLTIKAGTVTSDNAGSGGNFLGSGTVTIGDIANTGAAANLNFNGSNFISTNALSVVGNGASSISVTGWSQTLNGAIALGNNLSVVTNNAFGSSLTFGGGVTGTGNLVIQSNAAMSGSNSSKILFQTGALNMVGSITNSGTGSTGTVGNIDTTISAVIGTNVNGVNQNSANSRLNLTGANTFTSNILISAGTLLANRTSSTANPTSGALGNTQALGRTATISSGGTLNFSVGDVMGNGGSAPKLTLIANGGTIRNNSGSNYFNVLGPVQLNGGTLSSFGGGSADFPSFALTGGVTIGGSAVSTISTSGTNSQIGLQSGAGTTFDVADAVSGGGSDLDVTGVLANWLNAATNHGFLIKTGAGTMTLSGQNTYTGGTRIDNGTLTLGHATNSLANSGAINVNGGTLSIGGNSDTVGAVTLTSGSITGSGGTLTGTGSAFDVRSGTVSAKLGGTVGLTKTTTGTVNLSGANSYTGATSVNAGTLLIETTGSLANTTVTVGGASATGTPTLAGGGTIGGATTIAAAGEGVVGTHSVGVAGVSNGVGTQTFSNNLTYGSGSIFAWDVSDASTYDKVVKTGGSLGGSGAILRITSSTAYTEDFWNSDRNWTDVFSGTGTSAWNAIFSSITGPSVNWNSALSRGEVGSEGYFTLTSGSLNWTAIPEPTSALAGLLLGTGLLRRRRSA